MNSKVIPRVGQVWINNRTKSETELKLINLSAGEYFFNTNFTFKPANDLEWCAINAEPSVWHNKNLYMIKANKNCFGFVGTKINNSYSFSEVIDKRNELFGETEVKPKMKVSYVKCEMSLDDIAKAMIDGEILYSKNGMTKNSWINYQFLKDCGSTVNFNETFYRKVETPVTWQEEVKLMLQNAEALGFDHTIDDILEQKRQPSDWNDAFQSEIIEMCHLVASMTDKPE